MDLDPHTRVVLLTRMTTRSPSLLRGHWSAGALDDFVDAGESLGLSFVSLDDLLAGAPAESTVALVFDRFDTAVLRRAVPVLEGYGAGFSVVVESARVGQARRRGMREHAPVPPWSELRRLLERGGDIISGGHHGASLRTLSVEVAYGELLRSRCEIERRLGRAPRAIRYPFGDVSAAVAEVAATAGFEMGLTLDAGPQTDPMRWPVLRPGRFESPSRFARRVAENSGFTPRRLAAGG